MLRDFLRHLFGTGEPAEIRAGSGANRLKWWVCFSGALHLVLIVTLLVVPTSTARRDLPVPVYTVDLVAGVSPAPRPQPLKPAPRKTKPARIEPPAPPEADESDEAFVEPPAPKPPETAKATEMPPPPPKEKKAVKKPPEPKVKEAPPKKPKKKVVKPKKSVKPKKVVKRKKPAAPKKVAKKKARKKRAPKSPAKLVKKTPAKPKRISGTDSRVIERLRTSRIDDAVATARERAKLRRKVGVGQGGAGAGSGGGVVKGMDFLVYRNQMLKMIKDRWTWIGKRRDLEVTVGFGVGVDGEIFGLKLLKFSGDSSYDESVVRAVQRAKLPPPPRRYARDFTDVELTFRADDLDR